MPLRALLLSLVTAAASQAIWGWLRGTFGVRPMLSGVAATNAPAAALEGATWTFAHLGANVCVEVRGGVTRRCGGGPPIPRAAAFADTAV